MILWGKEHQARAEALAAICGEQSAAISSLSISNEGTQPLTCADATLTVWGHGNSDYFSEMLDVEFGVLIKNWKKKNPALKIVELITCDAQHNIVPLAGYAMRVAKFIQDVHKDIVVKALPVGQHPDDRSILWANSGTRTFCYLTAPSQETLDHANQRLEELSPLNGNDLGLVAAAMTKERSLLVPPNNFTVNGGGMRLLRGILNTIQTT